MDNLNYSVVGNCRTAAIISQKGSVEWFCLPDFDSPSVFGKILDEEKGGSIEIIVASDYTISQQYIPHTNVLVTTYKSPQQDSFDVIDFMPRYRTGDNTDYYTPAELYRMIKLTGGHPKFKVVYNPRLNYAYGDIVNKCGPTFIKTCLEDNIENAIYLYSSLDFTSIMKNEEIELTKNEFMLVSYNQKVIDIDMERVYLEYSRTKLYWLNWSNRSKKYSLFDDYIERSMLIRH